MSYLVLASGSATRARLLRDAGITIEIAPAHVDETALKQSLLTENQPPRAIADALAELKALRSSTPRPADLVLGADQVLEIDGNLISKSEDMEAARALLMRLRGKKHALITAAVLVRGGVPVWRHVERISLTMRDFSNGFLDDYLAAEGADILGSVGCYRLEERGVQLFSRIDGDYFSILGLPMLPLLTALREFGIIDR
jgi:septum formation protein